MAFTAKVRATRLDEHAVSTVNVGPCVPRKYAMRSDSLYNERASGARVSQIVGRARASEEGHVSHLLDDGAGRNTLTSVQLADQQIGGVGDGRAEDTRNVSSGERNAQLLRLVALLFRLRHDVLVEGLDRVLESTKFHHCVGDLPRPQRRKALEEATNAFLGHKLGETSDR